MSSLLSIVIVTGTYGIATGLAESVTFVSVPVTRIESGNIASAASTVISAVDFAMISVPKSSEADK